MQVQRLEEQRTVGPVELVNLVGGRQEQQDAVAVGDAVWVVADGMGGHPRGAEAAWATVSVVEERVTGPVTETQLVEAVGAAHEKVCALASSRGWANPGSTVVAVAVAEDAAGLWGVWCGDSRVYLWDGGTSAELLTEDHVSLMGGLSAALGDHGDAAPTMGTFFVPAGTGGSLLLCSDGLWGPLDRDGDGVRLAGLLADGGLAAAAGVAVEKGSDNVSALLVPVTADGWFWSGRWQRMEREADGDVADGRVVGTDGVDGFLDELGR